MQFIPKTHTTVPEAVEQAADRLQDVSVSPGAETTAARVHALVIAEHRAKQAQRRGAALPEAEAARLAELRDWHRGWLPGREAARRAARRALWQALGDGDLPADLLLSSGRLRPTRPEEWRTTAGERAMETGELPLGGDFAHEARAMIPKAALATWLDAWHGPAADRTAAKRASQAACNQWVLGLYQAEVDAGRPRLGREAAMAQYKALPRPRRFTARQMEEAIEAVPKDLKRPPGRPRKSRGEKADG